MSLRPNAHWQPESPKDYLVEDANALIQKLTGDETEELKDWKRITRRDLETIIRALDAKR